MYNFMIYQGNVIKTVMKYHYVLTRRDKILKLTISSVDKDVKQLEFSYDTFGNVIWYNHHLAVSFKAAHAYTLCQIILPANPTDMSAYVHQNVYKNVHRSFNQNTKNNSNAHQHLYK